MAKSDDDFDDYEYEEDVKPRVSVLNIALFVLNIAAAGAFVFLLMQDLEKRQAFSYNVFLHDVAILGLPLAEEENVQTLSREAHPPTVLTSDQLQNAFKDRKVGNVREPFNAIEEPPPPMIRPSYLTDEVLKDVFGSDTPYVRTQEEEIERVLKSLFGDIETAAKEFAAAPKTPAAKRKKLERVLLPLASNFDQVRKLDKYIRKTKNVESALADAATRRMYLDLLVPLEIQRPGDNDKDYLEKVKARDRKNKSYFESIGDLDNITLDVLKDLITKRLKNAIADTYDPEVHQGSEFAGKKRDTIQKRDDIALALFAVAHLNKPDGKPLYEKGPERAQTVVGMYHFALAAQQYTDALLHQQKRVLELIRGEREGALFQAGDKIQRAPGFVDSYPVLVQRIKYVIGEIDQAEKRIGDLEEQRTRASKNYEERREHLKNIQDRVVAERVKTAELVGQLRLMQASLFRAQLELADAADRNFELEILLRKLETTRQGEDE